MQLGNSYLLAAILKMSRCLEHGGKDYQRGVVSASVAHLADTTTFGNRNGDN